MTDTCDTASATAEYAPHMLPVSIVIQNPYLLKYNQRASTSLHPETEVQIALADHLRALSELKKKNDA